MWAFIKMSHRVRHLHQLAERTCLRTRVRVILDACDETGLDWILDDVRNRCSNFAIFDQHAIEPLAKPQLPLKCCLEIKAGILLRLAYEHFCVSVSRSALDQLMNMIRHKAVRNIHHLCLTRSAKKLLPHQINSIALSEEGLPGMATPGQRVVLKS